MRDVAARRRESGQARRRRTSERRTSERPVTELAGRVPVLGAITACVLAGSLFGPAFGSSFPPAVMAPVLAVGAVAYAGYEAVRARPGLERWRPVLTVLAGLLVIVETTLHDTTAGGLPTATSL
ncbi:MAG TPA: hypothetical protein VNP03_08780, partial [Pseudonocardia sp.]|nr:hypothetical protein [Pseudonocardia sp.]